MKLQLSSGQERAMDMLRRFRAQEGERVAVVTGYAGTGKTTLIKVIEEEFGTPIVLTPTGKAALRVTEATGIPACTIHRFMYRPEEDPEKGEPVFVLREIRELHDEVAGRLVLVDEGSMVDAKIWGDLRTVAQVADAKIVLMGDRFQLPPVMKEAGQNFSALDAETPFSVNLTEVVRQALDSPIIQASMILRSGKPEFHAMKLLMPVPASKLVAKLLELRERGCVTLVHRNATRSRTNGDTRKALGYEPDTLAPGEPLLVLQNNYALERYNGEIVTFEGWETRPSNVTTDYVRDNYANASLEMSFGVGDVDGARCMLSPEEVIGKAESAKVGNWTIRRYSKRLFKDRLAYEEDNRAPPHLHANYGYTLTCHKSQGSEWPEVLVVMESSLQAMNEHERKRWLYTAITRARSKVWYTYLT